jgi:phage-related minor tail protein
MREYGYSSDEVLKITEAVSTGLKLSGANTQEASSVITQFSQALAQGVLRGEEFNAVNEAVIVLSALLPPEWAWLAKT